MAGATPSNRRTSVLVVEDDQQCYSNLRMMLEHYDCDVTHAGSVAAALPQLDAAPDFIFLDLSLPDGEGTRVLERVRMTNGRSRVIVVSGETDRGMLWRAKALRPEGMLEKPLDFMSVLELLKPVA